MRVQKFQHPVHGRSLKIVKEGRLIQPNCIKIIPKELEGIQTKTNLGGGNNEEINKESNQLLTVSFNARNMTHKVFCISQLNGS